MTDPIRRPASRLAITLTMLVLAVAAVLPAVLQPFHLRIMQQILLFGGTAVAWGFLSGFTTYWSFGNAAFFGLGAFSAALTEQWLWAGAAPEFRLACGLGAAIVATFIAAALVALPILRLRGAYFAIGMLAFAEIIGEASKNFDVFQGAVGIDLPVIRIPGVSHNALFYWTFLIYFVINAAIFYILKRSRMGMGLICIGQDEDTANMMGVPAERLKLIAFVLSATMTGIGGALYAYSLGFITADSVFTTDISLNMILFNMLGGIGTWIGPLLGAAIMLVLTQLVLGNLLNFHLMITGAILVAIVTAAPAGIVGFFKNLRRSPAQTHSTTNEEAVS